MMHVERDPIRARINVWALGDGPGGRVVKSPSGEWNKVEEGELPHAPTWSFSIEDAARLVDALQDVEPPSKVMADALKDARMVRDRLLTIIERGA